MANVILLVPLWLAQVLALTPRPQIAAINIPDLRASVLAELQANPEVAASELRLAHRLGATRKALRDALSRLEAAGLVERPTSPNRRAGRSISLLA